MQVFQTIQSDNAQTALALGFFDGVHRAHAKVLRTAVQTADEAASLPRPSGAGKVIPAALTFHFDEGGDIVLPNKPNLRLIFTEEQRLERMEALGIQRAYLPDFSAVSSLTAHEFMCLLRDELHAQALACGEDYTFGSGASGTVALLRDFCLENGIALHVTPSVTLDGISVSSTSIREMLAEGDIPRVNRFLEQGYDILGKVLPGRHLGHTLGFPTLNQAFLAGQAVPRFGVYASVTEIDGDAWDSITSIGTKPTIPGERAPLAETHLLGAKGDFYGHTARVRLVQFMRPEVKFNGVEELKHQVMQDIEARKK